jgi:hypothetical protein
MKMLMGVKAMKMMLYQRKLRHRGKISMQIRLECRRQRLRNKYRRSRASLILKDKQRQRSVQERAHLLQY